MASPAPADPDIVTRYFVILAENKAPSTIRQAMAAMRRKHREMGIDKDPIPQAARDIRLSLERRTGRRAKQAKPIGRAQLDFILPRLSGRLALRDEAMLRMMYDGALRRSEAADARWENLFVRRAGDASLLIPRSKTDQYAEGAWIWIAPDTVKALRKWCKPERLHKAGYIFGIKAPEIGRRISRISQYTGLGAGYSGHSMRIGCARDLANTGASEIEMQRAGRWKSSTMPLRYAGAEVAGRGAVAMRLYKWPKADA